MSDLSAYERQRLENIARNQDVLRSLGLLVDTKRTTAPLKKRPKDDDDVDDDTFTLPLEPSRRSDRVSKKPALYEGLTDAYFKSEEKEEEDIPHMSTRPQRVQRPPKPTYADEWQLVPQRRRFVSRKPDDRRTPLHMPNLPVVAPSSSTVNDIPNSELLQPRPSASVMNGTSRSNRHPCPLCNKGILVRARDRATGFYFLNKHWCNGVERDMVRVG